MRRIPAVTAAAGPGLHGHQHDVETTAGSATDPVCGMTVDPANPRYRTGYRGRDYVFCGARCLERFAAAPERFVTAAPLEAAAGAKWTCPMHPEIVRDAPGACPICGMALEPMTPTAGQQPANPEFPHLTPPFWLP